MPATGVKALRFFKRETVPTSNMLMPVAPNLTAFTQPCNLMAQVHNGSGTPSQTQGVAQECSRLINRQIFRISQEHYWRS
jgi:hypothetical protein